MNYSGCGKSGAGNREMEMAAVNERLAADLSALRLIRAAGL